MCRNASGYKEQFHLFMIDFLPVFNIGALRVTGFVFQLILDVVVLKKNLEMVTCTDQKLYRIKGQY